jgi:sarcosine oxidase gamma subunit
MLYRVRGGAGLQTCVSDEKYDSALATEVIQHGKRNLRINIQGTGSKVFLKNALPQGLKPSFFAAGTQA